MISYEKQSNNLTWCPYVVFQARLGPEMFFDPKTWHHKDPPVRKYRSFVKAYADAYTREYKNRRNESRS